MRIIGRNPSEWTRNSVVECSSYERKVVSSILTGSIVILIHVIDSELQ
jgi:hypothetical protein